MKRLQWACVPLIVVLDQLMKAWTVRHIPLGGSEPLIPGVIGLTYVQNTGSAFGMFGQLTWLLGLLSGVTVVGIVYILIKRVWITHELGRWALFLLVGGALGNLIDRVIQGYVVDMFSFEFVDFAIFNVADSFVTIGEVLLILYLLFFEMGLKKKKPSVSSDAE